MSQEINLTTEDVFLTIQNHLLHRSPLSIIRYGDGESFMFGDRIENTHFILKKVLGYVPSESHIEQMKGNLIKAYRGCDIVGIPTQKHLDRPDQWRHTLTYFNRAIGDDVLETKGRASIDVFHEFLSKGFYSALLMDVDTLNYVSCRDLDEVFKEKFNIKNVNSFIISPEPTYTSGYVGDKHFPEQFLQIGEWISTLNCKGQLCLVGAGIPGKIYNNWFRDQGGVSLDIGSVFDSLAGFKTRGAGRGMDVIDNTYKL